LPETFAFALRIAAVSSSLANSPSEPFNELVLVVHGVGDPAPGSTISLLARSTCSAARPMIETNEVMWLHEDSDRGRFATAFPVHLRASRTRSYRTVFAEVFWGDLSQVRRGIFGVVRGLLDLVFGLRYVAFVAADQPGRAARLLQWLGLVSARAIHGPLLAVNFVLALILLAMAGTEILWANSCDRATWSSVLIFAIVATLLIAGGTLRRVSQSRSQERFWFWVLVTAGFLGVVLFLNHLAIFGGSVNNLNDVASVLQQAGNEFSTTPAEDPHGNPLAESLGGADRLPPIPRHDEPSPANAANIGGSHAGTAVGLGEVPQVMGVHPSRQMSWYARLLIVTMGMLWFSLMLMLIVMAGAWAVARCQRKANRRGLDVALLLPVLAIGGWGQFLPIVWLAGQNALSRVGKIEQFANLFDEAVPLLGIQCVMCVLLGLVQVLVFIYYAIWRPRNDVEQYADGRQPPRLIVNFLTQATTAACACIAIGLILLLGWREFAEIGQEHTRLWDWIHESNKYAVTILVPLLGLFFVAFRYLGAALDIVLDVVNHFYFRRRSEANEGLKFEDEFEEIDVSLDSGRLYFSKRAMIHSRMLQILEHFRRQNSPRQDRPALTVVSHSQGTVIAIEVLNSPRLAWLRESFSQIRLVTMGSPFTHIYQHYFSHSYPPLDQPYWSSLRQRVDAWINIFRVDDFVGTVIDFPDALRGGGSCECLNFPIKRFGHNNYWSDKQVIEILRKQAEFAWVADDLPRGAGPSQTEAARDPLRRAG
jgi:hypothetical protein